MKEIVSLDELKKIIDLKESPVLIDFHASWCGPCKRIAPVFQKLSEDNIDVLFLKVDVDEAEEIAEYFQVKSLPTFIGIKDGKIIKLSIGGNETILKDIIKSIK